MVTGLSPPVSRHTTPRVRAVFGLASLAFGAAGCGWLGAGNNLATPPMPPEVAYRCSVDADVVMMPLAPRGPEEPFVAIPAPPGWKLIQVRDSTSVRAALGNDGLRFHDFTPNAVITLADVTEDSHTPAQAITTEQTGLESQPDMNGFSAAKDGTICGYPSRTVRYRYEDRDATTLFVAGTDRAGRTWVCSLTIQTADPSNPQFITERAVILEKFQFMLKAGDIAQ
jgi:hypothetical protein